jgi:hypothetical protein
VGLEKAVGNEAEKGMGRKVGKEVG